MPHVPATPHIDHDRLLVAAYAAGDVSGADLETALTLVATCADCAALHRDLRSIAGAVAALPALVRPRDFRLAPEQAARLRPSAWRRLLQPFAGPRFAVAGPLGTGLATLGIAGLLVAGSLGAPLAASAPAGGGAQGPEAAGAPAGGAGGVELMTDGPAFAVPAPSLPAESPAAALQVPQPSSRPADDGGGVADTLRSSPGAMPDASGPPKLAEAPLAPTTPSATPLFVLAGFLLVAGVALGGLRLAARRLA